MLFNRFTILFFSGLLVSSAAFAEVRGGLSIWEFFGYERGSRGGWITPGVGVQTGDKPLRVPLQGMDLKPSATKISSRMVKGYPSVVIESDRGIFTRVTGLSGWQHEAYVNLLNLKREVAARDGLKLTYNANAQMRDWVENNRNCLLDLSEGRISLDYTGLDLDPSKLRLTLTETNSRGKKRRVQYIYYNEKLLETYGTWDEAVGRNPKYLAETLADARKNSMFVVFYPDGDKSYSFFNQKLRVSRNKLP